MKNIDNPSQTKPYSEHGTILHEGRRYPDIYKNTGCFEFSYESFDLFVSFLYTKLKNNPNIKWPSASDRENSSFKAFKNSDFAVPGLKPKIPLALV